MNLEELFPKHKGGMFLTHNEHKNTYDSAGQWIVENTDRVSWASDEAKLRSIETDEIWAIQWYPDTPVGFCAVAAPTLEELLKLANEP